MARIPFVSLFSGAMGLDLGLERAGLETAVCVENDPEAVETIRLNRPGLPVLGDITSISGADIREAAGLDNRPIRLVVGGPPCQAFSVFGRRAGVADVRGQLLFEFVRQLRELNPDTFVMENVRGLLSMPVIPIGHQDCGGAADETDLQRPGSLLDSLFDAFNDAGYRVDLFVVNAVNYGAPQIRERLIFIGNRHGFVAEFPAPRFSNRPEDGLPPFTTLGDVIGDGFDDPCPEVMDFSARKLKYLSLIPPGGNWRSMPQELQQESMGKSWHLKGGAKRILEKAIVRVSKPNRGDYAKPCWNEHVPPE